MRTRVLHITVLLFLKKILVPVSLREFFVFVISHPYPPVEFCYGFGMLLLCRDGFWEEKVGDCVKASIHLLVLVEVLLIYLCIYLLVDLCIHVFIYVFIYLFTSLCSY